jgi:hypothetical protein
VAKRVRPKSDRTRPEHHAAAKSAEEERVAARRRQRLAQKADVPQGAKERRAKLEEGRKKGATKAERKARKRAAQRRQFSDERGAAIQAEAHRKATNDEAARALAKRFLHDLGIEATSLGDRFEIIELANWESVTDALVMQHKPDDLRASVIKHLDISHLRLSAAMELNGVILYRGQAQVAAVYATHASIGHRRERIRGNFMRAGPHWRRLHVRLLELQQRAERREQQRARVQRANTLLRGVERRAERGGLPRPEQPPVRRTWQPPPPATASRIHVLRSLPSSVSDDVKAVALRASSLLRTARSVAFGHPVVLIGPKYEIRFEPIRSQQGHLGVPLTFQRKGEQRLQAALRLQTVTDPLAISFADPNDEGEVICAWVVALVAFAELSCDAVGTKGRKESRPTGPRVHSPWGSERIEPVTPAGPRSVPVRSRGLTLSPSLMPLGSTAYYAASYVAGHRRRLVPGYCCSDDARVAARAVGIELHEGETWVRPHARGMPHDLELTFRWDPPDVLTHI